MPLIIEKAILLELLCFFKFTKILINISELSWRIILQKTTLMNHTIMCQVGRDQLPRNAVLLEYYLVVLLRITIFLTGLVTSLPAHAKRLCELWLKLFFAHHIPMQLTIS